MVLDRDNRVVYACKSYRTSEQVLADFCKQMGYTSVFFEAYDRNNVDVYHTNVLMSLGTAYCIICTESIKSEDRDRVLGSIRDSGRKILDISFDQLEHFAGNMLELHNSEGRPILVMSASARKSLTTEQNRELSAHYKLLSPQLDYIETHGGGSARCMLAELF